MNFEAIKKAVIAGKTVCWKSNNYKVVWSDKSKEFMILSICNNSYAYLTRLDGKMIEDESDFFTED